LSFCLAACVIAAPAGLTLFFIFNLWPKKRSPRSLIKCESGGNKGFAPAGLPNPQGGPLISLIDSPLRALSTDGGARQSAKWQSKWYMYIKSRGLPGNAFRAPVARLLSSPAERQISRRAHPSQIIAAFVSAAGVPTRDKEESARASEIKTEMSKWVSCGVME
jgi:hypothetical protein